MTAAAVLRLPFPPDKLAEIVCDTAPSAATNSTDEEYTTFWLVVADQFAKRGVVCDRVRATALRILDGGEDLAAHEKLGMKPADLRRRRSAVMSNPDGQQRALAPTIVGIEGILRQ